MLLRLVADDSRLRAKDLEEESQVVVTNRKAARYRAARPNAKVSGIRLRIEEVFGLPAASVARFGANGRPLRGNGLIKTLRKRRGDV